MDLCTTDSRTYRDHLRIFNEATMLGQSQKMLKRELLSSKAEWRVWANQTFFSELAVRGPITRYPYKYINKDAWDGFRVERQDITDTLHQEGVDNLVVLTGDMHTYISSYVKASYRKSSNSPNNRLGIEIMTPSIAPIWCDCK